MIGEAMGKAEQMVAEAREQADRLLEQKAQEMRAKIAERLREEISAAETRRGETVEVARRLAQQLKQAAAAKKKKAVELVLSSVFPGFNLGRRHD